jgi:hypothetical protein
MRALTAITTLSPQARVMTLSTSATSGWAATKRRIASRCSGEADSPTMSPFTSIITITAMTISTAPTQMVPSASHSGLPLASAPPRR